MAIAGSFGEFFRSSSGLLSSAIITLFLIGIEAILDDTFECPSHDYSPVLAAIYSISFFLCPSIIFIIIGLLYFPGVNHKKRDCPCWSGKWNTFYVFLHVGKIPVIWLLIAMADGQFLSCFVVAVSNYRLDRHLYLYIFQTSGMLALTLFSILWYLVSKIRCECLEESRRTYSMLHDVEGILEKDELAKEKEEDTHKFLHALRRHSEFENRKLPQYMLEKEDVLVEKLTEANVNSAPEPEGGGDH